MDMDVEQLSSSLITDDEDTPKNQRTIPTQPNIDKKDGGENPEKRKNPRPPWGNINHPGLATVYLPHNQLVHEPLRPLRVQLLPSEDQASKASGPFGWKGLFDEIQRKPQLQRELSSMMAKIIQSVDRTPPYKVQAKWAPLHYIDACWDNGLVQEDPQAAGRTVDESLEFSENKTPHKSKAEEVGKEENPQPASASFTLEKALRREAALLKQFREFVRSKPLDDVNVYRLATPTNDVRVYVQAYLYEVLPYKKIFGGNYNWKIFCRGLHDYLAVGRGEFISVLHVIAGTRFSDIPWLKQTDAERSQLFYAGFIFWVYDRLVNPLVNRLYYVTLTNFRRNEYVFYRREIWDELVRAAVRERIDKNFWVKLDMPSQHSDEELFLMRRSAVYRPRFVPKPNGIRPLMVLDSSFPQLAEDETKCLALKKVKLATDCLAARYFEKGFGCQSDKDIQAVWQKFRAERLQKQDTRPLLFLAFDISRAYESVNTGAIKTFFEQLYDKCEKDGIKAVAVYDLFRANAAAGEEYRKSSPRFRVVIQGEPVDDCCRGLKPQILPLERVLSSVFHYMKIPIFKYKGNWYEFNLGVPQGAPASGWLLNLYLSILERDMDFHVQEDEMLVRFFDDILFITPYPDRLKLFARAYTIFYKKYGLTIAPRKTHRNIPLPISNHSSLEASALLHGGNNHEGQTTMSWYGWLFDLAAMGISVDMERFVAVNLSYTVPVLETYCDRVHETIVSSVRGKYCPIMLDLASSPRACIVQNIYYMFLLAGMRMLAYWKRMRRIARSRRQVGLLLDNVSTALIKSILRQLMPQEAMGLLLEFRVEGLAWIAWAQVLGSEVSGNVLSRRCKRVVREGCVKRMRQMNLYDTLDTWGIRELMGDQPRKWPEEFARLASILFNRE
ncbi:telomerase reverse transcriptase-like [Paramacrobiotus metropolitanus]|uniref:telomerase reverse transcriptase-like n=1 Tax=Paramacrobiotus metropolitanus TaxID=2943436 RepID=UPI002445FC43|nr:telomerase reverse transcriptase-like [Paramacrobiotus metropolitanus]